MTFPIQIRYQCSKSSEKFLVPKPTVYAGLGTFPLSVLKYFLKKGCNFVTFRYNSKGICYKLVTFKEL